MSFSLVYFCRIFTKRHKNNLLRISCVLYGLFHLCSIFSIFGTNFFFPKNNLAFWQMMQGTIFHFLGLSSILMSFFKERSFSKQFLSLFRSIYNRIVFRVKNYHLRAFRQCFYLNFSTMKTLNICRSLLDIFKMFVFYFINSN